MRFYRRFGEQVSILNSRMSPGERFDQYERAKNGDIRIIVGPRSALFSPFPDLGLIVIDEEHEAAYKSETVPKYHARETAIARAKMCQAAVVLGSATPSVESYSRARSGVYHLLTLTRRVASQPLPECEIVDLPGGIAPGQPFYAERPAPGGDRPAAGAGGADHAVFEPTGHDGVPFLQGLRPCDKMSSLRCVSEPSQKRPAAMPLLRL